MYMNLPKYCVLILCSDIVFLYCGRHFGGVNCRVICKSYAKLSSGSLFKYYIFNRQINIYI